MKTLQVIMAHAGGQAVFDRHLPIWSRLGHDMLVFCPENSRVETILLMFAYGSAQHHGAHSIERFRALLLHMEHLPYDYFVIQEYDSFSLSEPAISVGVLRGNYFPENDPKWLASFFLHPPLAFDRHTLTQLNYAARFLTLEAGNYFWDRWIAVCAELAKISVIGWGDIGFSQNTIEPNQITDAVTAARRGAIHFHGCKSQECFAAIMEAA